MAKKSSTATVVSWIVSGVLGAWAGAGAEVEAGKLATVGGFVEVEVRCRLVRSSVEAR